MRSRLILITLTVIFITGCNTNSNYTPSDPVKESEQITISEYVPETEEESSEETKVYSLGDIDLSDIPSDEWIPSKEVKETSEVESYTYNESTSITDNEVYTSVELNNTQLESTASSSISLNKNPYKVDPFVLSNTDSSYKYSVRVEELNKTYKDTYTGVVFGEQGKETSPDWVAPINERVDMYGGYIHQIVGNWYKTRYPETDVIRYDLGQPILIAAINTDISSDGYTVKGSYFLVYRDNPLVKVPIQLNTQQNGELSIIIEE